MFTPRILLRHTAPLLRPRATPRIPRLPRHLTTPPRRPPPSHTPLSPRSEKSAHSRRQALLTVGAIICMSSLWLLTRLDINHAESPTHPRISPGTPIILSSPAEKAAGVQLIPSGTSSVPDFPKTLRLAGVEYALIGLGIRTVSFLGIEVYVVGFYVAADDLVRLQERLVGAVVPGGSAVTGMEKEEVRRVLEGVEEGERFWEGVMEGGVRSLLRVVPTRNTDYQHLRDGWVRGIQGRSTKDPRYDDEEFVKALVSFKQAFSLKKAVPKKKTLLLVRGADGALECYYDGSGRNDGEVGEEMVRLGGVQDGRVSMALWLCYLAGKKVASEPARKSIIEGLVELVERPIGTVGSAMP